MALLLRFRLLIAASILLVSCTAGSGAPTTSPGGPGTSVPGASATAEPGQTPAPDGSAAPDESTGPRGSPSPVTTPAAGLPTEHEAVALVLSGDPRFADLGPRDPGLIGQGSWYEVRSIGPGYEVTVRIGWGDCPAGCISGHSWVYSVDPDQGVRLVRESGDELPEGSSDVVGLVTAGPVCPVERDPPDPACAPRRVEGAVLAVIDATGREVARVTSGPEGRYEINLQPGAYQMTPQPVEGLMGTPGPITVRVTGPGEVPQRVDVEYDTGIR
jgi:hypothetical protein